jgi:hypothetical protein
MASLSGSIGFGTACGTTAGVPNGAMVCKPETLMWFTVEDGLITKRTDVWDSAIFMAQIATTD